jgi:hypothetical protein
MSILHRIFQFLNMHSNIAPLVNIQRTHFFTASLKYCNLQIHHVINTSQQVQNTQSGVALFMINGVLARRNGRGLTKKEVLHGC